MDAIINYEKGSLNSLIAHRVHKGLGIVSCEVLGFNDAIEYSGIQHVSWNYISKTKQYVLFSEIETGSTIFYVE